MDDNVRKFWDTASPRQTIYKANSKQPSPIICDFFIESDSGIFGQTNMACHGTLCNRYLFPDSIKEAALSSSLRNYSAPLLKVAHDYWSYVLSPDHSPWRLALVNGVELIYNNKDELVGFYLPSLKGITAQVLMGLMIASRFPTEKPYPLAMYGYLRKRGFSQPEAMYGSAYFGLKDKTCLLRDTDFSQHVCFEPAKHLCFGRMLEGNPVVKNTDDWITDKSYAGVSSIFSVPNGRYPKEFYSIEEIKEPEKYNGIFPKAWEAHERYNRDYIPCEFPVKSVFTYLSNERESWYGDKAA